MYNLSKNKTKNTFRREHNIIFMRKSLVGHIKLQLLLFIWVRNQQYARQHSNLLLFFILAPQYSERIVVINSQCSNFHMGYIPLD